MEGYLKKVFIYAGLKNKVEPDIEDCNDAIAEEQRDTKTQTSADRIIGEVCKYFDISRDDLTGKRRNREFVEPRQVAIYLISDFLGIPLLNIGNLLGGRDHSTVLHARNKIEGQINTDPRIKRIVSDISKLITGE
jgi:chromosomal replication initiator protein